jgi:hypothetical protein
MAKHDIAYTIDSFVNFFFYNPKSAKYTKIIVLGLGASVVLGGSALLYRWYRSGQERAAYKQFAECAQKYARNAQAANAEWDEAVACFKSGSQAYGSTNMGAYFLGLEAQALIEQGKKDEALVVMDTMMKNISTSSPLYMLYKTKRALLRLDMEDEMLKASGLEELTNLAYNNSNIYNDVALYYLGYYYWVTGNNGEAKKSWQTLVDSKQDELAAPSPWAQQASILLPQIVS